MSGRPFVRPVPWILISDADTRWRRAGGWHTIPDMPTNTSISFPGVLLRTAAALLLVYGTWNPFGVSFYHWAIQPLIDGGTTEGPLALKFLVGVVLLSGWALFLTATRRSLGLWGAALALALTGGVIWLLISYNVVSARSTRGMANVALISLSLCLAAGVSWSFVSRRITGQVDTDVVE